MKRFPKLLKPEEISRLALKARAAGKNWARDNISRLLAHRRESDEDAINSNSTSGQDEALDLADAVIHKAGLTGRADILRSSLVDDAYNGMLMVLRSVTRVSCPRCHNRVGQTQHGLIRSHPCVDGIRYGQTNNRRKPKIVES